MCCKSLCIGWKPEISHELAFSQDLQGVTRREVESNCSWPECHAGCSPIQHQHWAEGCVPEREHPRYGNMDRQRVGGPSQPSGVELPPADRPVIHSVPPVPTSIPVSLSRGTEIHSASTELLTSEGLEDLRRLLTDTYNERAELTKEISSATLESNAATRRYQKWEHGFFMKRLFKKSFTAREGAAGTAAARLEELHEQLRLTTIATEITVDREQAEPYYRMRDEFAALSGCQRVWNVVTEKTVDRIAERSTAKTAVTRNPVSPRGSPKTGHRGSLQNRPTINR